jgi:arylsulfatase A-like enzyme
MKPSLPNTIYAAIVISIAIVVVLFRSLAEPAQPARPPNFVVVVVDMLRPDHLGLYGYAKNTSPNLDRLGKQGIVFENATSAAPWTLPSTVSLLTGLLPSEHGAGDARVNEETREISYPNDTVTWLPQLFAEHGYDTVAFHSHPYLRRAVSNIHMAFEEYFYTPDEKADVRNAQGELPKLNEHVFLETLYPPVESWLDTRSDRPFLMYIHAIDVHGPYEDRRILEEDEASVESGIKHHTVSFPKQVRLDRYQGSDVHNPSKSYLYDGHIRFVDDHLGMLHRKLTKLGIAEDTYIVFTSDHGEEFGEHQKYWGHGRYLYDSQIRVPLALLSHRNVQASPRRIASHVNTVGLLPTLASLADITLDERYASRGFEQLLLSDSDPPDWNYTSVSSASHYNRFDSLTIDGRYKLISDRKDDTREFFDLREDPTERSPIDVASQPAEVRARLDELLAAQSNLEQTAVAVETQTHTLSDSEIQALEALGYVQ